MACSHLPFQLQTSLWLSWDVREEDTELSTNRRGVDGAHRTSRMQEEIQASFLLSTYFNRWPLHPKIYLLVPV